MPSILVDDKPFIKTCIGPSYQIFAAAIVKVYSTYQTPKKWTSTDITGALVLCKKKSSSIPYFRVVDINLGKVVWEQEIYLEIDYQEDLPHFYSFSSVDCSFGFDFLEPKEGKSFHVEFKRKAMPLLENNVLLSAQRADPVPQKVEATPSKSSKKDNKKKKITKFDIGQPTNFVHVSHLGFGAETMTISDEWKEVFNKANVTEKDLMDPKTAELLCNFMQNHSLEDKKKSTGYVTPPSEGSSPISHRIVPEKKTEAYKMTPPASPHRNVIPDPPSGVLPPAPPAKPSRPQPPAPPASRKAHPKTAPPPPPAPAGSRKSLSKPPPPPRPNSSLGGPPPPPPPPPPMMSAAPVINSRAPPAVPSSSPTSSGPAFLQDINSGVRNLKPITQESKAPVGRNALLDSINSGNFHLRKVGSSPTETAPKATTASNNDSGDLVSMLQRAMNSIREAHSDSEDDEDDDWD